MRRRAGKINVEVTIKVETEDAAKTMASAITADKLNEKLKAAGLEEATMVSAPTVAKKGDADRMKTTRLLPTCAELRVPDTQAH